VVSVSAAHAAAFYDEVLRDALVWGVRDAEGFPAPVGTSDQRSMPFWSLASRAEAAIAQVAAYASFSAISIPLDEWRDRWLPGLQKDGWLVGLNWYGSRATGYDLLPQEVVDNLAAREPRPLE
jgi:hypothetical protein